MQPQMPLQKEMYVVVHGQSARFRMVKYLILIPLFIVLYIFEGMKVTLYTFLAAFVLGVFVHFYFRHKTEQWTKSWWLYKRPLIQKD